MTSIKFSRQKHLIPPADNRTDPESNPARLGSKHTADCPLMFDPRNWLNTVEHCSCNIAECNQFIWSNKSAHWLCSITPAFTRPSRPSSGLDACQATKLVGFESESAAK